MTTHDTQHRTQTQAEMTNTHTRKKRLNTTTEFRSTRAFNSPRAPPVKSASRVDGLFEGLSRVYKCIV